MFVLAYAAATVLTAAVGANALAYAWRARLLRSQRPCDRPEGLGRWHSALVFLRECAAWVATIALSPLAWIGSDAIEPDADGAVVLIHGLGSSAVAFTLLRRRLHRSGWGTVVAMRHPACLDDAAAIAALLHPIVEKIAASRPRQIVLVGHGFGGLVARLYVGRYRAPLVRRILTLGTPHRGSLLPPGCGRARGLLRPGGQLLSQLEAADRVPQQFDVIALHSTFDATVLPPANAEYPGAFNIRVNDIGHNSLLFSAKVYELVEENLAAPLRAAKSDGEFAKS